MGQRAAGLLAALEEQLQAEADAEEGLPLVQVVLQRLPVAAGLEHVHSRPDGADAGEQEAVSLRDIRGRRHLKTQG